MVQFVTIVSSVLALILMAWAGIFATLPTRIARAAKREACPSCGYQRAGLPPGAVCPECGKRLHVVRSKPAGVLWCLGVFAGWPLVCGVVTHWSIGELWTSPINKTIVWMVPFLVFYAVAMAPAAVIWLIRRHQTRVAYLAAIMGMQCLVLLMLSVVVGYSTRADALNVFIIIYVPLACWLVSGVLALPIALICRWHEAASARRTPRP